MTNRKKLIGEIIASLHIMRNKMQGKVMPMGHGNCITHSQLFVLATIKQYRNIGIKEISKKLNISSSATTQLVDALEDNDYVLRKANSEDRRALQLELSSKGRKRLSEMKNSHTKMLAKVFDALSGQELKTYLKLHKKILSKINR